MEVIVFGKVVDACELDVVRLVAGANGYKDLDLEPFPGKIMLRFTKGGLPGAVFGVNEKATCEAFLKLALS